MPHACAALWVSVQETSSMGIQLWCGYAFVPMSKCAADEVRNFVTELAHLAYSRGVPAGPIPTPAGAGDPNLATPPSSSGHIMQQAVLNLPTHLTPGHPSFDQHAYQLLLQQQHQQPQMSSQQQHPEQHQQQQQHQDASAQSDLDGSINAVREGPDAEPNLEGQRDAHAEALDLTSSAH